MHIHGLGLLEKLRDVDRRDRVSGQTPFQPSQPEGRQHQ